MTFKNLPVSLSLFSPSLVYLSLCCALLMSAFVSAPAMAQGTSTDNLAENDAQSLQQLLDRVRAGRVKDSADFAAREAEFRKNRDQQNALLKKVQADIAREERRSERLEKTFNENEVKLAELEGLLNERLGVFGELFGIVRQVAGETRGQIEDSLISGELRDRAAPLDALAKSKGLPEIAQLENLWFALQQEMTAQGETKRFSGEVVNLDGTVRTTEVMRVGPFTALTDDGFVRYAGNHRFADLGRQPPARFGDAADDLLGAEDDDYVAAPIDPSRGALLNLLLQMPTLTERINQGGLVGYIIILLGLGGIGIAVERIVRLGGIARKVKAQLASGQAGGDTPLGRVWSVYQNSDTKDVEALELKLDDAILKEIPPLERNLSLLKLLAGVAPLLGLLGTVTGMILTFQAITLFGTGDPKLMAGGISQALITTVLGLVVAIPLLLLHAAAATRSREIVQILEEQATGMIAAFSEKK